MRLCVKVEEMQLCAYLFLYLLHGRHQNTHSTSEDGCQNWVISADPHNFQELKLLFFDLLFRLKGKRRFPLDVDTNSSVNNWREQTLIAFVDPG